MNMPVDRVRDILKIAQGAGFAETPIGGRTLIWAISFRMMTRPNRLRRLHSCCSRSSWSLKTLTPREKGAAAAVRHRDGHTRTLEEVGKGFNVTRERIRQIEAKGAAQAAHPSKS